MYTRPSIVAHRDSLINHFTICRHLENVSEYFYLQNGGSMMDYPAWRKKTPTPQFISYSNANRIEQLILEEKPSTSAAAAAAAVAQSHKTPQQQQQQTTETIVSSSSNTTTTTTTGTTGVPLETDNSTLKTVRKKRQQLHLLQIINYVVLLQNITIYLNALIFYSIQNTQSQLPTKLGSITTAASKSAASSPSRTGATTSIGTAAATAGSGTASGALSTSSSLLETSGNASPPEAEIKIPSVGATPVAVSTKLPAAVVQLTQQGKQNMFGIIYLYGFYLYISYFISHYYFVFCCIFVLCCLLFKIFYCTLLEKCEKHAKMHIFFL